MNKILPVAAVILVLSCNGFPPVGGEDVDAANDVCYRLKSNIDKNFQAGYLKTRPGLVLCKPGNHYITIFIYGICDKESQKKIKEAADAASPQTARIKTLHVLFYDKKLQSGQNGKLLDEIIIKH